jgi:hypothetical protein
VGACATRNCGRPDYRASRGIALIANGKKLNSDPILVDPLRHLFPPHPFSYSVYDTDEAGLKFRPFVVFSN